MKFGKHLLENAFKEWAGKYLNYKALKKAIKVQSQTGKPHGPFVIDLFGHYKINIIGALGWLMQVKQAFLIRSFRMSWKRLNSSTS